MLCFLAIFSEEEFILLQFIALEAHEGIPSLHILYALYKQNDSQIYDNIITVQ